MGLDLYIPGSDHSQRLGSYSGVHIFRRMLIKAAIKYCEAENIKQHDRIMDFMVSGLTKNEIEQMEEYVQNYGDLIEKLKKLKPVYTSSDTEVESVSKSNLTMNDIESKYTNFVELIATLKSWIEQQSKINYEKISNVDNITKDYWFQLNLIGLIKFVNHSDCDGYHSKGDCIDIYDTFCVLEPYIKDLEWFLTIKDLFQMAIDDKSFIIYC